MAEKKSIHEFSTGTPQAQTAFVVDTPSPSAESGYVTEKVITSDLGNTLLGTLNYTQSLDTESKNIFGAVNELNENSVNFEEESIPDIPTRELPYYPSGEYSDLNTTDKHIVGAINEVKDSFNIEGVVIKNGNPEVRYWKYGRLLIVSLVCGTYAYTSETVISVLPENLRPIRGNRVYLPNNGVFGVDTNGEIWARNIPQYTIITNIVFLG